MHSEGTADPAGFVLGIETSCDDTSAAVLDGRGRILSSVVSSQTALHAPFGGIVPELASRAHQANIRPVVAEALRQATASLDDLRLIAVTRGPGLIGSLLVGLNYAKAVCYPRGIPLLGVNHLEAHFFSPFLEHPELEFPVICLIVSGGHTSLYHAREPGSYEFLASTRDDAAGEAFDKVAKMVGLPYPGGPVIDRLAAGFDGPGFRFALPRLSDGSADFSFSGIKTAVLYALQRNGWQPGQAPLEDPRVGAILKGFQEAVVEQLIVRLELFSRRLGPRSLLLCGGVACNSLLRRRSLELGKRLGLAVYYPAPALTTDNAAMVARVGLHYHFGRGVSDPLEMNADTGLGLGEAGE